MKIQTIVFTLVLTMACPAQAITYLFAHGLADTKTQAYRYARTTLNSCCINQRYIINNPLVTFDFPDATGCLAKLCRVNFPQTSLAQDNEIDACMKSYENIQDPEGVILMGLSRGASVASICAGRIGNNFVTGQSPVKALILESPFDSIPGLLNDSIQNPQLQACVLGLIERGTQYNANGPQPINEVASMDKDLPILLICSQQDTTVPATSTIRLYNKLRETGHKNTHILILKHGRHAKILSGPEGDVYHNVVHAFYKKYGLPHEEASAIRGQERFASCQPAQATRGGLLTAL